MMLLAILMMMMMLMMKAAMTANFAHNLNGKNSQTFIIYLKKLHNYFVGQKVALIKSVKN